jgi:hypothetical protein
MHDRISASPIRWWLETVSTVFPSTALSNNIRDTFKDASIATNRHGKFTTKMDTESQACDQCYRTKQTCSKSLPRCQRCLDASNPCTYSFGKFMGKPKRSSKIRRESPSNEMGDTSNSGKFFGLLNLKNSECFNFYSN